jgi:L-ribulose-5-phosphate 3-epimerase
VTRRALFPLALAPFAAASTRLPIKKAVEFDMLPKSASILDRFQIARDAGFEEIECPTTLDPTAAEEMLAASRKSGIRIHSVMNQERLEFGDALDIGFVVRRSPS